ncbi:S8 family serine peptidase [Promicromonospora sp. NPDC023805]|uniref:S8 family peptidase n=1 Tax=Promicromonospora sp. NPDC023805 TaxID=3154696 RepID=UPI0033CE35EC
MPEAESRVRDHDGVWRRTRDLDPSTVTPRRGGRVAPTRYVADRLIVRGVDDAAADVLVAAVRERARARGLQLEESVLDDAPSRAVAEPLTPRPSMVFRVTAGDDGASDDVWDLLDEVADAVDDEHRTRMSLDHVLTGHQQWQGHGDPNQRVPAVFHGPPPRRVLAEGSSPLVTADGVPRPVVAVLDTGIGAHPWFDEPSRVVLRGATLDGVPLGTSVEDEPLYDAEVRGRRWDEAALLAAYAGHGTFIAGVVHQVCPDAAILPVRIYGGDGQASEWDVARTLEKVLEFHLRGIAGVPGHHPVDVLVLSGGYYAEQTDSDSDYDGVLRGRLRDLRRSGVLVVVSAGNDGSTRPVYPAAWAPHVRRTPDGLVPQVPEDIRPDYTPLLPVAAGNPDGSLARFSNDGAWVSAVRPGTLVVSAMPTTFDGAAESEPSADGMRHTVDPDNFVSGFGLWSGTSFAAPVLAGELANELLQNRSAASELLGQTSNPAIASQVLAAWTAVAGVDGLYEGVPVVV